jgi:hypothetical protein
VNAAPGALAASLPPPTSGPLTFNCASYTGVPTITVGAVNCMNMGVGNWYLDRTYAEGSYMPLAITAATQSATVFVSDMLSPYWTPVNINPGVVSSPRPNPNPTLTPRPRTPQTHPNP